MARMTSVTHAAMLLMLVGCGALDIDGAERRGPCSLTLADPNTEKALDEPYRVEMRRHIRGEPPIAMVLCDAEGWGRVTMERTSPTGQRTEARLDAQEFNANRIGDGLDVPGRWHLLFSDGGGCVREVEIEVEPPS